MRHFTKLLLQVTYAGFDQTVRRRVASWSRTARDLQVTAWFTPQRRLASEPREGRSLFRKGHFQRWARPYASRWSRSWTARRTYR